MISSIHKHKIGPLNTKNIPLKELWLVEGECYRKQFEYYYLSLTTRIFDFKLEAYHSLIFTNISIIGKLFFTVSFRIHAQAQINTSEISF